MHLRRSTVQGLVDLLAKMEFNIHNYFFFSVQSPEAKNCFAVITLE